QISPSSNLPFPHIFYAAVHRPLSHLLSRCTASSTRLVTILLSLTLSPTAPSTHLHRRGPHPLQRSHRRSPIHDARSTTPIHGDSSTCDARPPWLPLRNVPPRAESPTIHATLSKMLLSFVGASMGTSNLKIPPKNPSSFDNNPPPPSSFSLAERRSDLWKIYCCDMPYPNLSFADISSAVVRQNLRPDILRCCPSGMANIMKRCWDANPNK
ncbi:hypothetical protein S245_048941, partial [Arachis hypogaea]